VNKTCSAISAIADINVANGTALTAVGLPTTVTITKSDSTTASVAVTWDGGTPAYNATTAGTYAFSGTITLPEGVTNPNNLKASVNVVVAEATAALAVEGVTAPTATSVVVDFNRNVTAADGLTFTFGGAAVTAANVAYATDKATLTVTQMVDGTTYAVVVTKDATQVYSGNVTYDKNEITALQVQTVDFNKTIGENFTLSVKLVDEDGDAIANKQIKFESPDYTGGNLEELKILTATTGADGIATFTWTRMHDGLEGVTVYSIDRPVVRAQCNITWTLSAQLVTLDAAAMANESLSDESAFEFTVTAKNANGSNYAGNLTLDFNINDNNTGTNTLEDAGNANIKIQYWNTATSAWVNSIAPPATAAPNELIETDADTATYEMTASDNGSKKFRVYTKDEGGLLASDVNKIVVTAWYDTNADGNLTATDPRAVTGAKSYVAGVPTITFTKKDAKATIATAAAGSDNMEYTEYELTVVDQFGKPYRGTVDLDEYAALDNNVTTVPNNSFRTALDTNADGIFDIAHGGATDKAINFRIGQNDANDDSIATVRLMATADADTIELTAYVDMPNTGTPAEVADVLDANDVFVKASQVTADARQISSFTITPMVETAPAAGGMKIWRVAALDQFGTAFTNAGNDEEIEIDLINATTGVAIDGTATAEDLYADVNGSTNGLLTANWAAETVSTAENPIDLNDLNVTALPFFIAMDDGVASTTYQIRIWSEEVANGYVDGGVYEIGEATGTATVTYAAQVLTSGNITAAAATGTATIVNNTDLTAGYSDHQSADGTIRLTYSLLDQSNQGMTTTTPTNVTWTIKNNGANTITINDGAAKTLAAGQTASYTTIAAAGANANATIDITSAIEAKVDISVVAEGLTTPDTFALVYTETIVAATNGTYNGTVVAFDHTTPAAADDTGWIILSTPVGYVVVPHNLGTQTYRVVGTTATEAQFKNQLTVSDVVSVDASGANAAFSITTNN